MQNACISPIETSDFKSITIISDLCFGANYLTISKLKKLLKKNGAFNKIEINNKIIGFCLAQIMQPNEKNLDFEVADSQTDKIAVIKTMAIHPNFQRKGFGTLMLKHAVKQIHSITNLSSIYYASWIESKSEGFCKSVKDEGFSEFKLYKNFWLNDSLQNNYTCIVCGNPPCNCSMRLYRKA